MEFRIEKKTSSINRTHCEQSSKYYAAAESSSAESSSDLSLFIKG